MAASSASREDPHSFERTALGLGCGQSVPLQGQVIEDLQVARGLTLRACVRVFLPVFSVRRMECVVGAGGDVLTICDLITATFGNYKLTLPKEFSCILFLL